MIIDIKDQEKAVHDSLIEAWNAFVRLKSTHPDDLTDFRRAIHECQRIMAVRQLRRIDPVTWPVYHVDQLMQTPEDEHE